MVGVGKLLKRAQKMQQRMEQVQEELAQREIEVSSGGGAVRLTINGQGAFKSISLDPEFLKEDASLVEETLLAAMQEAVSKARELSEKEMGDLTSSLGIPGLM